MADATAKAERWLGLLAGLLVVLALLAAGGYGEAQARHAAQAPFTAAAWAPDEAPAGAPLAVRVAVTSGARPLAGAELQARFGGSTWVGRSDAAGSAALSLTAPANPGVEPLRLSVTSAGHTIVLGRRLRVRRRLTAWLATDRAWYPPGERINASVVLAEAQGVAAAGVPLRVMLVGRNVLAEQPAATDAAGVASVALPVAAGLPPGPLTVVVRTGDRELARAGVSVGAPPPPPPGRYRVTAWTASSELVAGVPNRVYVRVQLAHGEPATVSYRAVAGANLVSQGSTGSSGLARFDWTPLGPDPLVLTVGGDPPRPVSLPPLQPAGLVLRTDRATYGTAETIQAEVAAAGVGGPVDLDVWQDGQLVAAQSAPLAAGRALFAVGTGPDLAGPLDLIAHAAAERPVTCRAAVAVLPPALDVQLVPDKPGYRAGETTRVLLSVRDPAAQPAEATVLVTVTGAGAPPGSGPSPSLAAAPPWRLSESLREARQSAWRETEVQALAAAALAGYVSPGHPPLTALPRVASALSAPWRPVVTPLVAWLLALLLIVGLSRREAVRRAAWLAGTLAVGALGLGLAGRGALVLLVLPLALLALAVPEAWRGRWWVWLGGAGLVVAAGALALARPVLSPTPGTVAAVVACGVAGVGVLLTALVAAGTRGRLAAVLLAAATVAFALRQSPPPAALTPLPVAPPAAVDRPAQVTTADEVAVAPTVLARAVPVAPGTGATVSFTVPEGVPTLRVHAVAVQADGRFGSSVLTLPISQRRRAPGPGPSRSD